MAPYRWRIGRVFFVRAVPRPTLRSPQAAPPPLPYTQSRCVFVGNDLCVVPFALSVTYGDTSRSPRSGPPFVCFADISPAIGGNLPGGRGMATDKATAPTISRWDRRIPSHTPKPSLVLHFVKLLTKCTKTPPRGRQYTTFTHLVFCIPFCYNGQCRELRVFPEFIPH